MITSVQTGLPNITETIIKRRHIRTLWHEVLIWNDDFCLSRWNQEDYW